MTMRRLASFIMADQLRATTVVLGFAALALVFPPLMLLSGAALMLVTARLGVGSGLALLGLSTLASLALSQLVTGQLWAGLLFSLLQWAPAFVLALILRYTVSLDRTLLSAVALGLAGLALLYLWGPDLTPYWREIVEDYLRPALEQAELPAENLDQTLAKVVQLMSGAVIASMLVSHTLSLLLARWWQSLLYKPGGFREEFLGLRLGRVAAALSLLLFAGALLSQSPAMTALAIVALVMFLFQGLAIVHNLSARTANPMLWLIGAYVLLMLALPQMTAALSAMGVLDNFVDIRSRLPAPPR
jgi:hypothetical protein